MLKILVCISKTPDTTSRITLSADHTRLDESGLQFIINPYDEWYALVRALELKEQSEALVHLVHIGGPDSDPVIRKALALGGEEAFRVNTSPKEAGYTALQIARVASEGSYDLILTGKETIDYNGSQVGGLLAGILDLPFLSLATHLDLQGGLATVHREIEGGEEVCEVALPCVISCQKGMAEPRIANVRAIMESRKKPIHVLEPAPGEPMTSFQEFRLPPPKSGVKLIDPGHPEELVRLLHEEAKVI